LNTRSFCFSVPRAGRTGERHCTWPSTAILKAHSCPFF
jgi:hypothetical protein